MRLRRPEEATLQPSSPDNLAALAARQPGSPAARQPAPPRAGPLGAGLLLAHTRRARATRLATRGSIVTTVIARALAPSVTQVPSSKPKAVAGVSFQNYGSHHDAYPCIYFTVACALGITQPEIDLFLKKLGVHAHACSVVCAYVCVYVCSRACASACIVRVYVLCAARVCVRVPTALSPTLAPALAPGQTRHLLSTNGRSPRPKPRARWPHQPPAATATAPWRRAAWRPRQWLRAAERARRRRRERRARRRMAWQRARRRAPHPPSERRQPRWGGSATALLRDLSLSQDAD